MCLGVPGRIEELRDDELGMRMGRVSFGGIVKDVCLAYLPEAQVGDYVLNHVGFAIRRIPPEDVQQTLEMYEQLLRHNTGKGPEDLMAADVRSEIEAGRS